MLAKAGVVVSGYVAALALALLVVAVHIDRTSAADRDASSGMHGFGDALLFLFAFGTASTFPTGLALYFLKAVSAFWALLAVVALLVAATGLGSVVAIVDPQLIAGNSVWSALAAPRIFVAPLFAVLFALAGAFSPTRCNRCWLLGAASAEGITSILGFVHWLVPLLAAKGA